MKSSIRYSIPAIFFLSILAGCGAKKNIDETKKDIVATIDVGVRSEPISPYLYGMFIEPLGNVDVGDLIDDGISAELIDDRKFFYPVDTVKKVTPVNKRNNTNQWIPIGGPENVKMDSARRYVGKHSPRISVVRENFHGISQSPIAVVAGKKYNGRVVLAGQPDVSVVVSLVWGPSPSQRSSFTINKLTAEFTKHTFALDAGESTGNATLEISGKGAGYFSVGAVSLMPADNIEGFRPDVIKLLKDLHSGIYRWGGNMTSGFDWRDQVGDADQRPPRYEYAWDGLENNDVGTHELVQFAKLIGVELSLTVNAGLGDAHSAADWVAYANGSVDTPMGKWRARNGHPEPFGIKLWCVGNEAYGWWQLGHTDLRSYTIKHNMFAEQMLEADPTIKLIASGASLEEMTITGCSLRATGKVQAEYDSASDWTGGLLRHGNNISFMSEHFYCAVDQRFDVTKGKYINVVEPLVDWTRRPANRVRSKVENYNEYHKRIPGSDKIPVYIDEWAYFTNWVHPTPTLGVTIGYARGLHEMFRNTNLIKMAGFTFGTSCLSFNETDAIYNSTGLMFQLYKSHLGSIPVAITANSPQPVQKLGGQPVVNAGGNTYPLDMIATLSEDGKTLSIAIVNPTESDQTITLAFGNAKPRDKIKKFAITGNSVDARNIVGKPQQVTMVESELAFDNKLTLAKSSINLFKYQLQ